MGVIFYDPFDHYTSMTQVWDLTTNGTPSFNSSFARFSGGNAQGVHFGGNVSAQKNFGANPGPTIYPMFACRLPSGYASGPRSILRLSDLGTVQVTLGVDALGRFQFYRGTASGGTAIGSNSGSTLFGVNVYRRIECKITFDGSAGVVELRLDGNTTPVISASGLNTKASANAYFNQFIIGDVDLGLPGLDYDDLVICDTSGSSLNGYLGDRKLITSMPSTGPTTFTAWTDNGASGASCVNSIPPNIAKYISDNNANDRNAYGIQALTFGGNADFVGIPYYAEKDDANVHTICSAVRSSASDAFGKINTLASSYQMFGQDEVIEKDPNGTIAWVQSSVNAALIGPKLLS